MPTYSDSSIAANQISIDCFKHKNPIHHSISYIRVYAQAQRTIPAAISNMQPKFRDYRRDVNSIS